MTMKCMLIDNIVKYFPSNRRLPALIPLKNGFICAKFRSNSIQFISVAGSWRKCSNRFIFVEMAIEKKLHQSGLRAILLDATCVCQRH